jgi:hypothetical protein
VIEANGGVPKTIAIESACANLTEVLAEINSEFFAAEIDSLVEAVASGNFVKFQTKATGADKTIEGAEGSGALAQLGIDAGSYAGDDGTEYAPPGEVKRQHQTKNFRSSGSSPDHHDTRGPAGRPSYRGPAVFVDRRTKIKNDQRHVRKRSHRRDRG